MTWRNQICGVRASALQPAFRPAQNCAAPHGCLGFSWLLLAAIVPAQAVIVDRVAITVGNKIITDSEIDQRIRLTAFQNDGKPEFSLASKRAAARVLINQKLVEREMDVGHYPRPSAGAGKILLDDYEKANYNSNQAAMDTALHEYGLTEHDLEDELTLQTEMLTFLNLRFRPAVQVTDQDVRKYYDEHMTQPANAAALNEVRAAIEQKLTAERADRERDLWLEDQWKRTKIEYNEKELEEKAK
jgi:hypothetical protein